MKTKKILSPACCLGLACIMLFFPGCQPRQEKTQEEGAKSKLKGTISISGAFALYPMTVKWAEMFMNLNPKVRIDISAGGAGKGMTDALSGMVDLGMFSRGVTQAEIDKGAWYIAVVKDAVVPTINAGNPVIQAVKTRGLSREQFMKIYLTQELQSWDIYPDFPTGGRKINVYTRSDACGAAQMWGEYLGKDQESLNGVGVYGDPGMAEAIKNDPVGIGFNNINYAYDMSTRKKYEGLEVVPIDLNANEIIDPEENFYETQDDIITAIKNNLYPSPPARDLYFVSKGKPANEAAVAFLKWILTDGQKIVNESGYVELSGEKIQSELAKL
ncbi:MAG TPA: substrate-binding domain-containing protein [Bacteroidales bacterium]|nr:substrate-binding domain-containing protein [Bacteroidales bacterium]HRZ21314.1 substrate-binding domain-containing protein [Bacteroidales bacterium]